MVPLHDIWLSSTKIIASKQSDLVSAVLIAGCNNLGVLYVQSGILFYGAVPSGDVDLTVRLLSL